MIYASLLTLAEVGRLVAITEFVGLVDTGGGTRGGDTAEGSLVGDEVNLDGGVSNRTKRMARQKG